MNFNENTMWSVFWVCTTAFLMVLVVSAGSCTEKQNETTRRAMEACVNAGGEWLPSGELSAACLR